MRAADRGRCGVEDEGAGATSGAAEEDEADVAVSVCGWVRTKPVEKRLGVIAHAALEEQRAI